VIAGIILISCAVTEIVLIKFSRHFMYTHMHTNHVEHLYQIPKHFMRAPHWAI
jgi:hypothetical protein